jgi:alpha-L-fucosidase
LKRVRAHVVLLLACVIGSLLLLDAHAGSDLSPLSPVPTRVQLEWQRQELHAFVHFGPNTFSGAEWGTGREAPAIFAPTAFDPRQWVRTFKQAGFTGLVITAKHHDGFCLWPSALSTHTVAASAWRGGKGDVLRDVADACRTEGLAFGVYLSPWDRNHPAYGTPEYNKVFAGMLEEVLGGYGPVTEVWFDGANGEGPNGKRQVYDWPLFIATVRRLQPRAVIFSDAGPDLRWVGNERGEAPMTVWSLIDRDRYYPGTPLSDELGEGTQFGRDWVPPECDVSIRPGWFYRASEDVRVKSAASLFDLYERSVGRNCTLLLNVPPDTRGLLADPDVAALAGFRTSLDAVYGRDLTAGATAQASTQLGDTAAAAKVLDRSLETYWAPAAEALPATVTLRLPESRTFDRVVLQEAIALGQRVSGLLVEAEANGTWQRIAFGTTIGHKRILPVPETTASAVRVTIVSARGTPAIAEVSLHRR